MTDISRRTVLGAAVAVVPLASQAAAADKPAGFYTGTKPGIGVHVLGYDKYNPWGPKAANDVWGQYMTADRWSRIKGAGFGHIRIAIDPAVLLRASGSDAELRPYLARIAHAVDDVLRHGLKCIVDMQTSGDDLLYNDDALMFAAFNRTATWTKAKVVWQAMGSLLKTYPTTDVAFEVYNETDQATNDRYVPALLELCAAFRSSNRTTKMLVGPCGWAGYGGYLAPGFDRVLFDPYAPVGFVHHNYDPHTFTHQGVNTRLQEFMHRLEFPPNKERKATNLSLFDSYIDADPKTNGPQKAELKSAMKFYMDDYYSGLYDIGPDGLTKLNRLTFADPTGGQKAGGVYAWQVRNGVSGSDMFITEYGTHRDFGGAGASTDDAARWLAQMTHAFNIRGYNRTVWCEDDSYWTLRRLSGSGNRVFADGPYEPSLLRAIGL